MLKRRPCLDEPPCGRFGMLFRSAMMTLLGSALTIAVYEGFRQMAPGRTLLPAALAVVVGLPLLVLLARRIVHRGTRDVVVAVSDGLLALSERDYSLRLAVERQDEAGLLVFRFNRLAEALRSERNDLYQRQLLLETVLGATSMIAVISNEAGRVVYSNGAARQFFGGRKLEGRDMNELVACTPPELQEAARATEDVLFTCEREGGEPETFRLTRHHFEISTQLHTLFLLRPLTKELARKEVETWKKAIRVLSHEVNNSLAPITSLTHSARLMLDCPAHAQRLRSALDTIEERAGHLRSFLDGYASFARLPMPAKRPVTCGELLAGVTGLYPYTLIGEPPARPVLVDPAQMQQVLINLLKNAVESGSPADDVAIAFHDAGDGIELRVLDRGKGMSDEVLRNALLPFYSTKRSGTGLGLSLCREIVDAHGGRLALQRREGGGIVVCCWLPTAAAASLAAAG